MDRTELSDIVAGRVAEHRALVSPTGAHVLVLTANEAANSQWVEMGALHAADGTLLAQIGEWNWHVDHASFGGPDRLSLSVRRYPGDAPPLALVLDLGAKTATIPETGASVALAGLGDWLETWYARHRARR